MSDEPSWAAVAMAIGAEHNSATCHFCTNAVDPRNGGVGPHVVEHVASGKRALCGGPGYCAVCDQAEREEQT